MALKAGNKVVEQVQGLLQDPSVAGQAPGHAHKDSQLPEGDEEVSEVPALINHVISENKYSGDDNYKIFKIHKNNIKSKHKLKNRLTLLNGQIMHDWLYLTHDALKIKSKELLLN